MARSESSHRWRQEHVNDPCVKQARKDDYRARSSYKLLELKEKDRLLHSGMLEVDRSAPPGGWSQVVGGIVSAKRRVLATDILPMAPLKNVDFIQGDFREEAVLGKTLDHLAGRQPEFVISEIEPSITGVDSADQAGTSYLLELALDRVRRVRKPQGVFVAKVYRDAGSDDYLKDLRKSFDALAICVPAASRPRSREGSVSPGVADGGMSRGRRRGRSATLTPSITRWHIAPPRPAAWTCGRDATPTPELMRLSNRT